MEIPPKFEIKFNRRERGARRDNQDKIQIKKPQAKLLATEGTARRSRNQKIELI
jgi:hypothetical protein